MSGDQIENKQNMQEHSGRPPQSRDRRIHVRRAPEPLTYVELGQHQRERPQYHGSRSAGRGTLVVHPVPAAGLRALHRD